MEVYAYSMEVQAWIMEVYSFRRMKHKSLAKNEKKYSPCASVSQFCINFAPRFGFEALLNRNKVKQYAVQEHLSHLWCAGSLAGCM